MERTYLVQENSQSQFYVSVDMHLVLRNWLFESSGGQFSNWTYLLTTDE